MNLLNQKKIDVKSFAFTKQSLYLENHLNMPHYSQARGIKDSFRLSDGNFMELRALFAHSVQMEMRGQRTKLKEKEKNLLEYSTGHIACCTDLNCLELRNSTNQKTRVFKDVVFTSHAESYNIHHFVLEILPVLWMQRELLNRKSLVLMGSHDSRFAQELVDLLDLNLKVITVPIGSVCYFKDSIFLETVPFRVYPVQILEEIRSYVWRKLPLESVSSERKSGVLFLGRGDQSRNRRKIENEHLLLQYLESNFGSVRMIRPGLMDLQGTINSIARETLIAGPTGGALVNLIWARNMSDFIEIIPDTYPGDTESKELSKLFSFAHHSLYSRNTDLTVNFSSSNQEVMLP